MFDDAFGSSTFSPWGDSSRAASKSSNPVTSESAAGANKFDPFGGASLGVSGVKSKSGTSSPWLDDFGSSKKETDKYAALSSSPYEVKDAFGLNSSQSVFSPNNVDSMFGGNIIKDSSSTGKSPFSVNDDPFGASDSTYGGGLSDTAYGGFGDSDSDMGAMTPAEDPFGTVDPFKDVVINEDIKFSWDDEPDPFMTDSGIDSCNNNNNNNNGDTANIPLKKDPFNVSFDANKNVIDGIEVRSVDRSSYSFSNILDETNGSSNLIVNVNSKDNKTSNFLEVTTNSGSTGARSKSVLADPIANLLSNQFSQPVRSKTAMAEPIIDLESFDPLASFGNSPKKNAWISNEDLINENFGSGNNTPPNLDSSNNNTNGNSFKKDSFGFSSNTYRSSIAANAFNTSSVDFDSTFGGSTGGGLKSSTSNSFVNNFSSMEEPSPFATESAPRAISESDQFQWATRDSFMLEAQRKAVRKKENVDLEKALALSSITSKNLSS